MLQPKEGHHQAQYKILISGIKMKLYNNLSFSVKNEISLY